MDWIFYSPYKNNIKLYSCEEVIRECVKENSGKQI
jgi:hypothetical protein